jgi:quinol monooxygenase YgiN
MVDAKLTVIARVRANEGMEDKVKQECLALVDPSRKEQGCLRYDLYQSTNDPTLFIFYENWESREDLERHLETPHSLLFDERTAGLLDEPEEITFCDMISSPHLNICQ